MYLLICLALLGSAVGVPFTNKLETQNELQRERYILPDISFPTFYDISLFLDPDNTENFFGNVSIRVIPNVDTDEIVMHAMAMDIDNIEVYHTRDIELTENLFANFSLETDDTQLLRIQLDKKIGALQPHVVHIHYTGQFSDNMYGIYISTYEENGEIINLITSQLQPTFARRVFPCYDEPALKAVFRTTIYAPPTYTVVRTNMPERNDKLKEEVDGYTKYEFEDSLSMSTYLLAFLVSNLKYIENDDDPLYHIPVQIYSRNGTQDAAEFALDFSQRSMIALENYTEFGYAFPKLDKVAVPDFGPGAMENWGLVIYREAALLVHDGVTTTSAKQRVASTIAHENAHMWFGNEVGPQSWTYTWLNEGFASFFDSYITDMIFPEWRIMDQFVINMQDIFQTDALLSINPMTNPVYSPSEILGTFNDIAYGKSSSVIRMMQHFLTPEVFRQGLIIYIKNNHRKSASPSDLYAALQQALDESDHTIPQPISTILDLWTNQGGFPVITVRRTAENANSIFINQERYLTDGSQQSDHRWDVPINWVLSSDPDFSDTTPQAWLLAAGSTSAMSINIPGLSEEEWFIVNKQQTGYYRVNYDESNWQALAKVLSSDHETIDSLNRAQIVDDSFNLARSGRLNYIHAFEVAKYLVKEKDYIPWAAANGAFSFLDIALSETEAYGLFQEFLLELTSPLYEELGFSATSVEEHVAAFHRSLILNINCNYGNEHCVNTSNVLLENFKDNPDQQIDPDIENIVFCTSLRGGSRENFDFLWNLFVESTDANEKSVLLNALGCTSNEEARTEFLNKTIDDDSEVKIQDRHTIIISVANASPENLDAALEFVIENYHLIQPRVDSLFGATYILDTFSRRLTASRHVERINDFITRHENILTPGELASVATIRKNLDAAIAWKNEYLGAVNICWLDDNYGNGATAFKSSILIVITTVLAILYV